MGITALGIAIGYVLVLTAGAVGALAVLVWLFGEAPVESTGTGRETMEVPPSDNRFGTESVPPASVGTGCSEDAAA